MVTTDIKTMGAIQISAVMNVKAGAFFLLIILNSNR